MAERLRAIRSPHIAEVRGRGAMWGVELRGGAARAMAGAVTVRLLKRGILILPGGLGGNVVTLTPPFEISDGEIDCAVGMIAESLQQGAP